EPTAEQRAEERLMTLKNATSVIDLEYGYVVTDEEKWHIDFYAAERMFQSWTHLMEVTPTFSNTNNLQFFFVVDATSVIDPEYGYVVTDEEKWHIDFCMSISLME
ncbi:Hypothetical predicted protein, partial [Mytilus galloprovincialis]